MAPFGSNKSVALKDNDNLEEKIEYNNDQQVIQKKKNNYDSDSEKEESKRMEIDNKSQSIIGNNNSNL